KASPSLSPPLVHLMASLTSLLLLFTTLMLPSSTLLAANQSSTFKPFPNRTFPTKPTKSCCVDFGQLLLTSLASGICLILQNALIFSLTRVMELSLQHQPVKRRRYLK